MGLPGLPAIWCATPHALGKFVNTGMSIVDLQININDSFAGPGMEIERTVSHRLNQHFAPASHRESPSSHVDVPSWKLEHHWHRASRAGVSQVSHA